MELEIELQQINKKHNSKGTMKIKRALDHFCARIGKTGTLKMLQLTLDMVIRESFSL